VNETVEDVLSFDPLSLGISTARVSVLRHRVVSVSGCIEASLRPLPGKGQIPFGKAGLVDLLEYYGLGSANR
jgi:hypothetical protein